MAIPINNVKTNLVDRDDVKFVGIKLPLHKSDGRDGYFESTTLTYDEVKFNIINLIKTRKGERRLQPNLGIGLDKYLFENITDDLQLLIEDEVKTSFSVWLPFVNIIKFDISTIENNITEKNKLLLHIEFYINNNPSVMDSVDIIVE